MKPKPNKKDHNPLMRQICLLVSALALAPAAQAAYPDIILGDHPVAYYRLEESTGAVNALDATTNHFDAAIFYSSGNAFPQLLQPGIYSNSFNFDGGGTSSSPTDYISIPYSTNIAPVKADGISGAAFTAEAWVEANGQPSNYSVPLALFGAYSGSGTYANASGWNFYQSPGPTSYWIFNMKPSPFLNVSTVPVVPFQWYHLVGTYDGTNASFYLNGVFQGSGAANPYYADNGYNGYIGAGVPVGFLPFNGSLDEVAIYNYALSPAQISAHYVSGTNSFRAVSVRPGFVTQPSSTTNFSGTTVTFTALANGTAPLGYQWKRGSSPIAGATNSTYSFVCVYPADNNATFSVTVSNLLGSTNSSVATLTVLTNLSTLYPPFSITRNAGSIAAFRAVFTGALPIHYQWYSISNSTQFTITNATNDTLWLNSVSNSQSGMSYFCVAANPFVTNTSPSATLTVQSRSVNVPLTSHYAAMIAAEKPVAYWRLDETSGATTATDAIGSFDGAYDTYDLISSFTFGVAPGIPYETDPAVRLDNTGAPNQGGSVVDIPYALELNPVTGPWSAEMWVNPATLDPNNYHTVISSMYNVGGSYNNLFGWLIYQTPDAHFVFDMFNGSAGGSFNPGTAITSNTWYHLVITDDLTNQYFYVNGVLVSELSQSFGFAANGTNGDPSVAGGDTIFGQRSDNGFGAFDGTVDDVAFYNYTMTPAQILSHYKNIAQNPTLSIKSTGTSVTITWSAGTLLSSTNANGPFTAVSGATSPYTITATGRKFFRAVTQ